MVFDYESPPVYHFGMGALTKLRKAAGLSQGQLANLVGTSQPQIQRLENGKRGLSRAWATRIAPFVGATPSDLMFGDRKVHLVGHVGAGSEAHFYADGDGNLGWAKMPSNGSESTVAVRVRGDSLGAPFDGWVIYYDERRDPPTDDLVGELCVVGLPSGQVLVKKLMRGRVAGHYDLWPVVGAPQTDQVVEWAALVINMIPASLALVEESQDSPAPVRRTKRGRK